MSTLAALEPLQIYQKVWEYSQVLENRHPHCCSPTKPSSPYSGDLDRPLLLGLTLL